MQPYADCTKSWPDECSFEVIAIAASAGGLLPLTAALSYLPHDFPAAVIVLLHRTPERRLPAYLGCGTVLDVREAAEGDCVRPGLMLVAPPRIHTTVDAQARVRLIDSEPIRFVRPRADLLFCSLAMFSMGER